MQVGIQDDDDDLYREIILDHYRNPRNKGLIEDADVTLDASNPLCGDELHLTVRTAGGGVEAIGFTGQGCSISQASASMMCEAAPGRSTEELAELGRRFRAMLLADGDAEGLGDLEALQGVRRYPVRIKCAILPWNALLDGLGTGALDDDGTEVHRHG
jgi:nitrogen fixation NifU-like protein